MPQQNIPGNKNGWKAKWTSTEDILVLWYDFWWKKGCTYFEWFTPCLTRNFVLFHHTSPSSSPFPEKKQMHGNAPNNKKTHLQQLIRKFKEFHFCRSCFVFWRPTVQWKALLERSELVVVFLFLWVSGKGWFFFFSEFFGVVGGWGFRFSGPVAYWLWNIEWHI